MGQNQSKGVGSATRRSVSGDTAVIARPYGHRPPRRRGPIRALVVGIVVVLLVVLLAVADRVADQVVEQRSAESVQSSLGLGSPPQLDITGFPFLTQVVRGRLDLVRLNANDLVVQQQGKTYNFSTARLDLYRVQLDADRRPLSAGQLKGSVTADWAEASRMLGVEVSHAGTSEQPNRVAVTYRATLFGQEIPVQATAVPRIDQSNGRLKLDDVQASVAGHDIPQALVERALSSQLDRDLPLPLGLRATGITADAAGLTADVEGENVPLDG